MVVGGGEVYFLVGSAPTDSCSASGAPRSQAPLKLSSGSKPLRDTPQGQDTFTSQYAHPRDLRYFLNNIL